MTLFSILGILPDALKTNCAKCTEKQKTVTLRTVKRLKKEYPKTWAQLQELWDPEDKYVQLFEATYGDRWKDPLPQPSVQIANRFGDDDTNNEISPSTTKNPPKTTTKTKPVNTVPLSLNSISTKPVKSGPAGTNSFSKSTEKTIAPSVASTSSSPSTITISSKTTTKKPLVTTKITTTISPITSTRVTPIRLPLVPNLGASIQATVSLGTNIVGNIIKGLGALGTRVAETGAGIAEVVVKNFSKPL